jgi:hypothetical protein
LKSTKVKFAAYCLTTGLLAVLIAGFTGCAAKSAATTTPKAAIVSIAITPSNPPDLTVHNNLQLTATATYADGSTGDITNTANWTGFNNTVLTVSTTGSVYGVSAGSAKVNAALGGITSLPVLVTVVAPQ